MLVFVRFQCHWCSYSNIWKASKGVSIYFWKLERNKKNQLQFTKYFKKSLFIPDKQIFLALEQESHFTILCVVIDFVVFLFVPLKTINKNSLPELIQCLALIAELHLRDGGSVCVG